MTRRRAAPDASQPAVTMNELREAQAKAVSLYCRNPAILCMSSWKSLRSKLAFTPLADQIARLHPPVGVGPR
jgi:hypothetical protein